MDPSPPSSVRRPLRRIHPRRRAAPANAICARLRGPRRGSVVDPVAGGEQQALPVADLAASTSSAGRLRRRLSRLLPARPSAPSASCPRVRRAAGRSSPAACPRCPRPARAVRTPVAPPSAAGRPPVVTPSSAAAARLPMDPSAPLLCIVRPPACELRPSCWPSICCSHEPFPSGDIFPPLLVSSLPISHILCCSFVLLIWERTEEGIICHLCYCFALMWPLISVAVVQASCFLGLPLMVMRLQYAPISCLGCAVIFK